MAHQIIPPTPEQIFNTLKNLGYVSFLTGAYNLNIIAIRNQEYVLDAFNDLICIVYKEKDSDIGYKILYADATTLPGSYWITHPMNGQQAACIAPGQYLGAWNLGQFHQTPALLQRTNFNVYRYTGSAIDSVPDTSVSFNEFDGMFLHESFQPRRIAVENYNSSAGCIVPANKDDKDKIIGLCTNQIRINNQNYFSFTLINESDVDYL